MTKVTPHCRRPSVTAPAARMPEASRWARRKAVSGRPEDSGPTAPAACGLACRTRTPPNALRKAARRRPRDPFSRRPRMPARPLRSRSAPTLAGRPQAAARTASRHSLRSRHACFRAQRRARCPRPQPRGGPSRYPPRHAMRLAGGAPGGAGHRFRRLAREPWPRPCPSTLRQRANRTNARPGLSWTACGHGPIPFGRRNCPQAEKRRSCRAVRSQAARPCPRSATASCAWTWPAQYR